MCLRIHTDHLQIPSSPKRACAQNTKCWRLSISTPLIITYHGTNPVMDLCTLPANWLLSMCVVPVKVSSPSMASISWLIVSIKTGRKQSNMEEQAKVTPSMWMERWSQDSWQVSLLTHAYAPNKRCIAPHGSATPHLRTGIAKETLSSAAMCRDET